MEFYTSKFSLGQKLQPHGFCWEPDTLGGFTLSFTVGLPYLSFLSLKSQNKIDFSNYMHKFPLPYPAQKL